MNTGSWLVTGGSGVLGRALCAHLSALGHRVTAVRRDHPEGEDQARRLHLDAARALARAARSRGARFVLVSIDQLWGDLRRPATEDVVPAPVNAYGRTKAAGERAVLAECPRALVAPRPGEMALDCGRARRLLDAPMPSVEESIHATYGPAGGGPAYPGHRSEDP